MTFFTCLIILGVILFAWLIWDPWEGDWHD